MFLGRRIKELREEAKYTQRALAQKLNISSSTLAMYETGKRDPDTATLSIIAQFFCVSTDYLLGLTETKNTELSSDELELIQHYRNMQNNEKELVRRVAETISPENLQQSVAGGK